jgi:serine/threonine protein kinase
MMKRSLAPNTAIAHYCLLALLGAGGMGEVYLAEDTKLDRKNDTSGTLSPDGRWLAYASDESGQFEIYVQSFPGGCDVDDCFQRPVIHQRCPDQDEVAPAFHHQ